MPSDDATPGASARRDGGLAPQPEYGALTNRDSAAATLGMASGLADVISGRITMADFAWTLGVGVDHAARVEAEIINAVLTRRMRTSDGVGTARVPTSGLDVFALSELVHTGESCIVELVITVSNELFLPVTDVVVECVSFSNSSMSTRTLAGPIQLVSGSALAIDPGGSVEYRARYVASAEDFHEDGLLICSFVATGSSNAGELALGQGDAWIELGGVHETAVTAPWRPRGEGL